MDGVASTHVHVRTFPIATNTKQSCYEEHNQFVSQEHCTEIKSGNIYVIVNVRLPTVCNHIRVTI